MLTDANRATLAEIARRAFEHPMDFRDFANPSMWESLSLVLTAQSIQIGRLIIAYSHDRMPPDWRQYRHLSVSDAGNIPNDEVFMEIAGIVGMDKPATWNDEIVRFLQNAMTVELNARHAFQPLND